MNPTHINHTCYSGVTALLLSSLLLLTPAVRAGEFLGEIARFSPDDGQPIFPAGNLSVFKQMVIGGGFREKVGASTSVDLWLTTLHFGGELEAGMDAAFGFEVGLCFGGISNYDLAFQPSVTLPDRYPYDLPIPITIAEGLLPSFETVEGGETVCKLSKFETTFPPLGKAYADLIFDVGADLRASACVGDCFDAIRFDFSTCDIPALQPSGVKLFKESKRCDPALSAKKYCAIELASFNRNDDNKVKMLNVGADNVSEFLAQPYKELFGAASGAFTVHSVATSELRVAGSSTVRSKITAGRAVQVTSTGKLPAGLDKSRIYYISSPVIGLPGDPQGVRFKLATSVGGGIIQISGAGSGTHSIREFIAPPAPLLGGYGTLTMKVPTVSTDSSTSTINADAWPFTANSVTDRVMVQGDTRFSEGTRVIVSSVAGIPAGLKELCTYYVRNPGISGLDFQLATIPGGPTVDLTSPGLGTHQLTRLAVANTAKVLRSSGSEDVFGIGVDIARMVTDFLIPPPVPKLSDNGSYGPVAWNYVMASVEAGPLIQLQTDFEMTWDLAVVEITFTVPGTQTPRAVKLYTDLGAAFPINGSIVTRLTDVAPAETFHLTNCGPKALPMIQLADIQPVDVNIKYELRPKLKAQVSLPISGQLDYQFLSAGASIDYGFGDFGLEFGPVLSDSHKFKFGDFVVYDGQPFAIQNGTDPVTGQPLAGNLVFTMQAAGPPSFDWKPSQLAGNTNGEWFQRVSLPPSTTNWVESLSGQLKNGIPGETSNSSHVAIKTQSPFPTLYEAAAYSNPSYTALITVDSLKVGSDGKLALAKKSAANSPPGLIVGGGFVENSGVIIVNDGSSLKLNSPDSILCGPGEVSLSGGSSLLGYNGPGNSTFTNYNVIDGGRGDGDILNQMGLNGGSSSLNNIGSIRVFEGAVSTSASRITHQGTLFAGADANWSITTDKFTSSVGSEVLAEGSGAYLLLSFSEVEHAGLFKASDGGFLSLGRNNDPGIWNAGQSLTHDVGFFRAEGPGSVLQTYYLNFVGGCFDIGNGGTLDSYQTEFTGSALRIGTTGTLVLNDDGENRLFTRNSLSNSGILRVSGQVEFVDNKLFANSGLIEVPAGGVLSIRENIIAAPGASAEAAHQPGTSNVTSSRIINKGLPNQMEVGGTLLGGVWDIAGTLVIEGASIAAIGANSAVASTPSGSIDALGQVAGTAESGSNRVLSQGRPAEVLLRGPDWSFPALTTVLENRGSLRLLEGANFPGPSAPGGITPGGFTNRGRLDIGASSAMTVGGDYVQVGPGTNTTLGGGATLVSASNTFRILGGSVVADSTAGIFNISDGTLGAGTSLYVRAPLVDDGQIDPYTGLAVSRQDPVAINLGGQTITTIAAGASLELHGRISTFSGGEGIHFPALANALATNHGEFILTGNGFPYSPDLDLNGLTNTGQVIVRGAGTKLFLDQGGYFQSGANSSIYVGAGTTVAFGSDSVISDGEFVVEISARSPFGWFASGDGRLGAGYLKAPPGDLNGRLVIDFTGTVAESSVDIGDTWEIAPRSSAINGVANVGFRLNGGAIPAGWLPPGSELTVVQFQSGSNPQQRGLAIRVAPAGGFTDYYTWALNSGLPDRVTTTLSDPFEDGNGNGTLNAEEYFYGLNGTDRNSPAQFMEEAIQAGADGNRYFEFSFVRPSGIDASYTPYQSPDLHEWSIAPMRITDIGPGPAAGLERVTLRSSLPVFTGHMFFRIQPNFNPDNFDAGLLPETFDEKYITWGSGLENFDGVLFDEGYDVGYQVVPGRVLYFNTSGSLEGMNSVHGGTAPNGVDRNAIYQFRSPLSAAAVHAGLLNGNGERGILKVTFLPPHATPFIGSTQTTEDGSDTVTSTSINPGDPSVEPYCYKVEIHRFPDKLLPAVTWPSPGTLNFAIPLGPAQLNATASIPGTFVYDPPAGTLTDGGRTQRMTLNVVFTPNDSVRYRTAAKSIVVDVQADNITSGLTPQNPIGWNSGLGNHDQALSDNGYNVSYAVGPGTELFYRVSGSTEGRNSTFGGTAPDGVTRNFIYRDSSPLSAAVVHAGLLSDSEQGIIVVTFLEPQTTPFIGSTQPIKDQQFLTITDAGAAANPYNAVTNPAGERYSYKVELHSVID
jgi:hypothetical protein